MLNRSDQPRILEPEQLVVQRPERIKLPNGVPLSVLNAGDNEVTRIDLLMAGGRWQQKQPLQALFTNRMLREGTRRYDAAQIAEKAGLLRSLAGIVQCIRVCLCHPLFSE